MLIKRGMPPKNYFGRKNEKKESIIPEGMIGGVFYIRVSTDKQEEKGNGLEAQKEEILKFAVENNMFQIGDFFEEIVSGGAKIENRPIFIAALDLAKKHDSYLVTSKLDRLSRDSALVNKMMAEKVKFVTVQHGMNADPFLLRIYAAVGEKEREMIGERTRAGMGQLKKRYEEDYQKQIKEGVENPVKKRFGIPDVSKAPTHVSHVKRKEATELAIKYRDEYILPTEKELTVTLGKKPTRKQLSDKLIEKGFVNDYGSKFTVSILAHNKKKLERTIE